MGHDSFLPELLTLLLAAVVAVPLAHRLGLGSILGYLIAGAALGPWGISLVSDVDDMRHVAEFGVIFLLFIIGIEMKPNRLWLMRRLVFGLGGAQVSLTGAILSTAAWYLGLPLPAALIAGFGLALSSTAMGLQVIAERGELNTSAGRASFAVLLFQDLMVPLLLTAIPLLARKGTSTGADLGLAVVEAVGVLALALLAGRYLLRPFLRMAASAHSAEVFMASALLVALGLAWVMGLVGLSMALGAFLGGLMLAESEFRHQIEADIQPFRGLLLGLFFMSVGMSIDFSLMAERWASVLALVAALMMVKALLLFVLSRAFGYANAEAVKIGLMLSQGGEFAFVLLEFAVFNGAIVAGAAQFLILVVSLSMALTPLATLLAGRMGRSLSARAAITAARRAPTTQGGEKEKEAPVIIAGFGRVGQTVAAMLREANCPYFAFDLDLARVQEGQKVGHPIFYGDASQSEVLHAAHAERARMVVVTMDDAEAAVRTVWQIRMRYPELPIHARARDLAHSRHLSDSGATTTVPETLEASLQLGSAVLVAAGAEPEYVAELTENYRRNGYRQLTEQIEHPR